MEHYKLLMLPDYLGLRAFMLSVRLNRNQ